MLIISSIQAIAFYCLPTVVGKVLSQSKSWALNFTIGSLVLFILRFIIPEQIYFPLVWIIATISLSFLLVKSWPIKLKPTKNQLQALILAILLSVLTTAIWLYKSPYPLNWDLYQHQSLVGKILSGNFSFFTTEISDTFGFNSYPPMFHLLVAVSQFPVKITPNQFIVYWQSASFIHLLLVSLASYFLAWAVTKDRNISVISMIVGTLVFDSVVSFTNLFLLPQTLAAVLFIFLLTNLLVSKKPPVAWKVVSSAIALVLFHYLVGALAAAVYLSLYIYKRFDAAAKKLIEAVGVIPILILTAVGIALVSQFVDLSFLNRGEAALYNFNLLQKSEFVLRIYGLFFCLFLPLGVYLAVQERAWNYKYVLFLLLGFLIILVSNFPYIIKFFVLARFFVNLFIAFGIWSLLVVVGNKALKIVVLASFTISLLGLFILNTAFWKTDLVYRGNFTHLSQFDLKAAEFINSYYKAKQVFLISDPATQLIIEGLSSADSPGGGFMTEINRSRLFRALTAQSPKAAYNELVNMKDKLPNSPDVKLFAVSGRSRLWAKADTKSRTRFDFNIWSPKDLSYEDNLYIQRLAGDKSLFSLVYRSPYIAIFELH